MNTLAPLRITLINPLAKALVIACCVFAGIGPALSQGRNFNDGDPGERMIERLSTRFNLSTDQQEELRTKINAVSGGTRCRDLKAIEEIDKCRADHRTKVDEAVKDVLTEEQYSEYQTFRKNGKGRRMQRLTQELNLTTEQQTALQEVFNKQRQTCLASNTQDERRNCMRGAKSEMDATLDKVLTAEQKSKWETMKKQRGDRMGRHHGGYNGGQNGNRNGDRSGGPNGGGYNDSLNDDINGDLE